MFDSYVAPTRSSWKRRTLFIGSIVFHSVAAVGLLVWSVLHVEELPPPEVTLTFFNAPPPPPPPPPPAGAQQKKTSKPKIVPQKAALTQPRPAKEEPAPEPDHGSGEAGGVAGGAAGGVVGGVVGAPPTAAPPPPPPPAAPAKMVPSFVFDKERLASPDPHLPDDFKNRNPKQTFNASYRICVGTDGRITDASVVRGIGSGVDDAVLKQVRSSWLYKPQPLPVCSIRAFVFKIN